MSGSKKLVDKKKCVEYGRVTKCLAAATRIWRYHTEAIPGEQGKRFIHVDRVERFEAEMVSIHADMQGAVRRLNEQLPELKIEAKARLKDLYCESDYPDELVFEFQWSYPSVAPDERLKRLDPELYEREYRRYTSTLESAVAEIESKYAAMFKDMVESLLDKLTPSADGSRKLIVPSAIEKFKTMFAKFREYSVTDGGALQEVVDMLDAGLDGVSAKALKQNPLKKVDVKETLTKAQAVLATLVVDAPDRDFDFGDDV